MDLPERVAELIESTPARVGLCVMDVGGGPGFAAREAEVFAQASAIKIPIVWALNRLADRGAVDLNEPLAVDPLNGAGGCGVLQHFAASNTRIALGDLAVLMIVLSDNVATNLLIDRVGFDAVNALIEDAAPGDATRLRRKMIDLAARAAGRENTSTPRDAASLMLRLAEHAASGDSAAIATLKTLRLKKESPVTAALGRVDHLATKPGMLSGLRTEWYEVRHSDARHRHYTASLMADSAEDGLLQPLFRSLALAIDDHMVERSA